MGRRPPHRQETTYSTLTKRGRLAAPHWDRDPPADQVLYDLESIVVDRFESGDQHNCTTGYHVGSPQSTTVQPCRSCSLARLDGCRKAHCRLLVRSIAKAFSIRRLRISAFFAAGPPHGLVRDNQHSTSWLRWASHSDRKFGERHDDDANAETFGGHQRLGHAHA
jgi:hypothetical protein